MHAKLVAGATSMSIVNASAASSSGWRGHAPGQPNELNTSIMTTRWGRIGLEQQGGPL